MVCGGRHRLIAPGYRIPAKKGSNLTCNPFRLLQYHKMSACVQLLPLPDVREQPFHIFPRWALMRLRCRQGHHVRHEAYILRPRPLDMLAFVIIPVRGIDGLREPVNRHIGQLMFLAEMPQQIACRSTPHGIPLPDCEQPQQARVEANPILASID